MATYQYSLFADNQSANSGTLCIYQQDPRLGSEVRALAWATKPVNPTTRVVFRWNTRNDFAWYDSGPLEDGILCVASQVWPADLSTRNQVTLTRNAGGFTFENPKPGPVEGNLYIQQDGTIPADTASVGIGMAGVGTFVVQAQPNLSTVFPSPEPQYWLAFSQSAITTGTVLDLATLTGPKTQVVFAPNVFSMSATLGKDNQWSVAATPMANSRWLATHRTLGDSR